MNINSEKHRTWLITGASSGFGRALAQAALAHGDRVIGTFRDAEQARQFEQGAPQRAISCLLDLSQAQQIAPAIEDALSKVSRIDVLVNNAGLGQVGAVEEISEADGRRVMETNFFGLLAVTKAALPRLRAQKSGHILNFSSGVGFVGMPGLGLYSATKFAVEGLSECLAAELAPLGIRVTIIEPGAFRTSFSAAYGRAPASLIDDYAPSAGATRAFLAQLAGHEANDPVKAAEAILALVESTAPPLRLVLGSDTLQLVRNKLINVAQDFDAWEALSASTAFGQE